MMERSPSFRRPAAVMAAGFLLLAACMLAGLGQGQAGIGFSQAIRALLRTAEGGVAEELVRGVRLPRAVMGALAGSALAVAGVLLQTVTRNALASAGTMGINAGAFFVVVAGTVFFPSMAELAPLPLAFAGGCLAAVLSYLLAGGRKSTPVRMALSGMIVTLVISSFTGMLQLLFENETGGLFVWGSGLLQQNDWSGVRYAWPWIVAGLLAAWMCSRRLDVMNLGEETARSLGQNVGLVRGAALALAVLLAAVTVSVVGPIGFIGLMAPHLVRLLGLKRHGLLLPAAAVWGAALLTGADLVSRLFISTLGELPAGAVTAALGAPCLIALALRETRGKGAAEGQAGISAGGARWQLPFAAWLAGRAARREEALHPGGAYILRSRLTAAYSFRLWVLLAAMLLAASLVAGIVFGAVRVPPAEVLRVLGGGGESLSRHIVLQLRLPRELAAAAAGALLAASGALLQGAVRNPLADPSVVGITSGAGAGALLLLTLWPAAAGAALPLASAAGAFAAAALVCGFAYRSGLAPTVLTLVGIAVSAAGAALVQLLVIRSAMGAAPALAWLAGSTYARGWDAFTGLGLGAALILPAAWLLGRRWDLLAFGDSVATGLGLKLRQTRLLAAALGVAAAAVAVAYVGTVGFIGLLAPHAARLAAGQNQRRLLVLAPLLGAVFLVLADLIGKTIIAPKEIPSGLVTALVGTPYLLFLLWKSAGSRRGA
jgi:ferric hydroxamate transport system permease protein